MAGSQDIVDLRAVVPADRFLVRRWLTEPHVEAWWGSRATAEADVTLALSSSSALCRMILYEGNPVGYAQAVDVDLRRETKPADIPAGSYDVDLFVGAKDLLGKGIGRRALDLLTADVFATTLAVACCVVPSIRNEAAVRAFEKAGFRWVAIFDDPINGPSWVMLKLR
jgi:aminoglycoside 6'-N-acetyltransferase